MGSDTLGPLSRAVDKALSGMKKGEVSKLTCSKDQRESQYMNKSCFSNKGTPVFFSSFFSQKHL